jgi:hypothetical protein
MLKYGAYEGIIHSDYLTASRDYYLPNQSGTIALTSDIPANQNLQSVTDEGNTTTNSIFINELNLYDGSNDQYANIKAGEESFIFTSTATWNASFQFDFSNITGLPFKTYNLPFSDGTLALTSDIPSIPTLTSELTNDGADGVNPFITALDIPTNGLPAGGTAGQILTKVDATDYNATWQENFADWTSVVKHTVKNNGLSGTITKGTAVYVTGSNGTNMLVGRASNASESTSSKTMGLMQSDITTTGGTQTGFVITEGLIQGLNTAGQTAGDPVWLGVNGALIYGLTNKPYAPAHLVFIGIVTKISAGNGEIFVKVQNGFELKEIHDVDLITNAPVNNDVLVYDSATSLWKNKQSNYLQNVTKDITNSTALTGTTAITLMKSILIPANTYATGDIIRILNRVIRSTATGTATNFFYINTTNSLTGATLVSTQSTASRFYALERNLLIKSTTISETVDVATTISSDILGVSTSANSDLNINWSVNQYIIGAFQNAAVGNSTVMSLLIIQKF